MRHTNFRAINSSFKIIDTSTTDVEVWTFTLDDGLAKQYSVTPDTINDFFESLKSYSGLRTFMSFLYFYL